jgi:hypothetical protein
VWWPRCLSFLKLSPPKAQRLMVFLLAINGNHHGGMCIDVFKFEGSSISKYYSEQFFSSYVIGVPLCGILWIILKPKIQLFSAIWDVISYSASLGRMSVAPQDDHLHTKPQRRATVAQYEFALRINYFFLPCYTLTLLSRSHSRGRRRTLIQSGIKRQKAFRNHAIQHILFYLK